MTRSSREPLAVADVAQAVAHKDFGKEIVPKTTWTCPRRKLERKDSRNVWIMVKY